MHALLQTPGNPHDLGPALPPADNVDYDLGANGLSSTVARARICRIIDLTIRCAHCCVPAGDPPDEHPYIGVIGPEPPAANNPGPTHTAGPGNGFAVPDAGPCVSGRPWLSWSAGGWHARGLSFGSHTLSSSTTYRFPVDCDR